jgi:hypothetical protein
MQTHRLITNIHQPRVYCDARIAQLAHNRATVLKSSDCQQQMCDVPNCTGTVTRFVGTKGRWWMRFCSRHKDIAYALNMYTHDHPNARGRRVAKNGI